MHEYTALAGLFAIAAHGLMLLGDPWLRPGVGGIAVPFVIDYRSVYVAAGIGGGYLAALLGLSFYIRRRVGVRRWRSLHKAMLLAYVLSLVHTIGAGTDAASLWLRVFMFSTAGPVVVLLLARVITSRGRAAQKRVTVS
jgi:sulfoxide reductase heme-binding subunit YedZ